MVKNAISRHTFVENVLSRTLRRDSVQCPAMQEDVERVLIAEHALAQRVAAIAGDISASFPNSDEGITIISVLAGSLVFLSDLIRQLPHRTRIGFLSVSSYSGRTTTSTGAKLESTMLPDLRNRDVLIVDDIVETGSTLRLVQAWIREGGPRSVRTAVLLRKTAKTPPGLAIDYVGFDVEDRFVVGYGLDYDGLYRNLPYIAVLRHEAYNSDRPG